MHGTAATTNKSLNDIFHNFAPLETFMVDGGKHFKNQEVMENCEHWGTRLHTVAAYSPWVNGLVEGTNRLLLYVLARLCAPEVGEDGWQATTWDKLPATWPDHFDKAIHILNWHILPTLKFCPKEILLGLVVNTSKTPMEVSSSFLPPSDIDTHMTYAVQQHLDGYAEAVHHAVQWKAAFDCKVTKSRAGVMVFDKGQLVQVYNNKLALTLSTERKLVPLWSPPHCMAECLLNSYKLKTLAGTLLEGLFNVRHLQGFTLKEGMELATQQKKYEGELTSRALSVEELNELEVVVPAEGEGVAKGDVDEREWMANEDMDVEERMANEDLGNMEFEVQEEGSNNSVGFFYDDEDKEKQGDEDIGIGVRVAARRRGCLHNGGGQME